MPVAKYTWQARAGLMPGSHSCAILPVNKVQKGLEDMTFGQKVKLIVAQLMRGRNGADELGMAMLIAGLVLSMADWFVGIGVLTAASLALYVLALCRMFSRNVPRRATENAKFLSFFGNIRIKVRQWWIRQKRSKEYKYFRCPECRSLMRLKRGTGKKHMVCPKCKKEFDQKA